MKVFYEVSVLAVLSKSFEKDGDTVEYKEVYFLNETDDVRDVIRVTTGVNTPISQKDEGTDGVAEFDFDVTGRNKPKLISFKAK